MYDYKTNSFKFAFPKTQPVKEKPEKEEGETHPIDESDWQIDDSPY